MRYPTRRVAILSFVMICVMRFVVPDLAPADATTPPTPAPTTTGDTKPQSAEAQAGSGVPDSSADLDATSAPADATEETQPTTAGAQPGNATKLTRLDPKAEVWVDMVNHRVIVGGKICLREGQLEMFACPKGTKEHESIVAVNAPAYLVHTGLLAIGARNGHPVQYDPVYKPAAGSRIAVAVIWKNEAGKAMRIDARELIRHVRNRKPLDSNWVFAGSNFWEDEQSGERFYQAEGGELICLSNFSTATLDLPVQSSHDNADLLYEAWTDRVPPLDTPVRLVLTIEPPAGGE